MLRPGFALVLVLATALACERQTDSAPPEVENGGEAAAEFEWPSG